MDTDLFDGAGAQAMREYLSVVHGQVLSAFHESFTLLRFFLQQYQAGLEEIDQIHNHCCY